MNPNVDPMDEDSKYIIMEALSSNMSQIEFARSFLSVVGGCVAGILNATNLRGLFMFISIYMTIVIGIAIRLGFDFKLYANNTFFGFMMSDLSKHGLSFVLFWTLTYTLVYIY